MKADKLNLHSLVFAICPATLMSLMYPVSSEINGVENIEKTYTLNVLSGGVGIIFGALFSGGYYINF